MAQILDYSYSHPDLTCIKNGGISGVARYIGDPDPNSAKYLDAAELKRIRGLGLSVVVVRETTAGFMFTDSGAEHARVSRRHCNDLGLHNIPIYYALDVDPRGLSSAQRNAVTKFLIDACNEDGGDGLKVGIYGSDDALDAWAGQWYCRWGWQTYAWSTGRISPKAHFRQYKNGVSMCGGTVDLNETYYPDWGQWPRPYESGEQDVTPEEHDMLAKVHHMLVGSASGDRIGDLWNQGVGLWDQGVDHSNQLALIQQAISQIDEVDVDEQAIANAVLAVLTPEAIAAGIPDDIAEQVANELHARLSD